MDSENDARAMEAIARTCGFAILPTLLSRLATRDAVRVAVTSASKSLVPGDIFFVFYSGHGGAVGDPTSQRGLAETWCLYDGHFLDDELYELWRGFEPGVRIVFISDCCYSGGMGPPDELDPRPTVTIEFMRQWGLAPTTVIRAMPSELAKLIAHDRKEEFDAILTRVSAEKKTKPLATVLLLTACQANQLAFGNTFTNTLRTVWNDGKFRGTYRTFYRAIQRRMPPIQSPGYWVLGPPDDAFEHERPFTIGDAAERAIAI
jgi:hypothetical protein